MASKRIVEVFSAGCAACEDVVVQVRRAACSSCEVTVLDMRDSSVAKRAKELGIQSLPSVVIDGKLASCCVNRGINVDTLRASGLGQTL